MEEGTVNFNKIIGGDMPKLNERDDENEVGEYNDNECDEKDVDDDSNSERSDGDVLNEDNDRELVEVS